LNYSSYNSCNFDRTTNPPTYLTDFAQEIRIRQMRILAGSVTSLSVMCRWCTVPWQ